MSARPSVSELAAQLDLVTAPLEDWLVRYAGELPSLLDVSDADMALMYLRHLRRHLVLYINPES